MRQDVDRLETEGIPLDTAARLEVIQQRIEHPLTEEQTEQVRKRIARSIALGATMRGYPLSNADEPEIAFDPFVGGDR